MSLTPITDIWRELIKVQSHQDDCYENDFSLTTVRRLDNSRNHANNVVIPILDQTFKTVATDILSKYLNEINLIPIILSYCPVETRDIYTECFCADEDDGEEICIHNSVDILYSHCVEMFKHIPLTPFDRFSFYTLYSGAEEWQAQLFTDALYSDHMLQQMKFYYMNMIQTP